MTETPSPECIDIMCVCYNTSNLLSANYILDNKTQPKLSLFWQPNPK